MGWKPISEISDAQRDEGDLIVSDGSYVQSAYWHWQIKYWGHDTDTGMFESLSPQPTHWTTAEEILRTMPIPNDRGRPG